MLDELLELTVGQVRELLAYIDADIDFDDWVNNHLDEDDFDKVDKNDHEDWDDEDCGEVEENEDWEEEDEEEDDYWEPDDEEETPSYPTLIPSEEELAHQIADDIRNKAYTINNISGLYSNDFINRVRELV
jgi:hypothetical protein